MSSQQRANEVLAAIVRSNPLVGSVIGGVDCAEQLPAVLVQPEWWRRGRWVRQLQTETIAAFCDRLADEASWTPDTNT